MKKALVVIETRPEGSQQNGADCEAEWGHISGKLPVCHRAKLAN
jgi:hypothetical protein